MHFQKDEITVILAGVKMKVQRLSTISVPHEVTVVIPRAELRRWLYSDGRLVESTETILNSITIAHSPRHESEKRSNNFATWKYTLHNAPVCSPKDTHKKTP